MSATNNKQSSNVAKLLRIDTDQLKQNKDALLIIGPTAVGKSKLAIGIAHQCEGEIISADSCAVYRGLDIGTAKPTQAEREAIPHHLIDICEPSEHFNVGIFFEKVSDLIPAISRRGKLPILVGGTMMYVNALLNGINQIPIISPKARRQAQELLDMHGLDTAHEMIREQDPVSHTKIASTDRQRLTRAWEVLFATGRPLSNWLAQKRNQIPCNLCLRIIMPPKPNIYRNNLEQRYDDMISDGLVHEISNLIDKYGADIPALKAVGYRQLLPYVHGELDLVTAVAKAKLATWQFARRQMTWIRKIKLNTSEQVSVETLLPSGQAKLV